MCALISLRKFSIMRIDLETRCKEVYSNYTHWCFNQIVEDLDKFEQVYAFDAINGQVRCDK